MLNTQDRAVAYQAALRQVQASQKNAVALLDSLYTLEAAASRIRHYGAAADARKAVGVLLAGQQPDLSWLPAAEGE